MNRLLYCGNKTGTTSPQPVIYNVSDVFNVTNYTGNNGDNTITTGIKLANPTITNTVTGSSSITIPKGVTSITIIGKGGTGGDNSWYNPGQPYIAPTSGQAYIAPTAAVYGWAWTESANNSWASPANYSNSFPTATYAGELFNHYVCWANTDPNISSPWLCSNRYYVSVVTTAATAGQPYIAPTSGQPYIAPSSGGGPYYGTNTTVTLNGVTYTYQGGYGGAATPRTDIITLPGDVAYTLAYSVGSGGSVNYTYVAGTLGEPNGPQGVIKLKARNSTTPYGVYDTIRGTTKELVTSTNAAHTTQSTGLVSFLTNGFKLGSLAKTNTAAINYVATTFKKIARFSDIVEYIGNGAANREIPHALACIVGMIEIKAEDVIGNWIVRHKDAIGEIYGDLTNAQNGSYSAITGLTIGSFTVNGVANTNGVKYIAYLVAHDSLSSGVIQCGTYTGGLGDITNTVTGSSSITIPKGVTSITIIGKGGTGGDNSWYNPGQPYIAPTSGQAYIAPTSGQPYIAPSGWVSDTATSAVQITDDSANYMSWPSCSIGSPINVRTYFHGPNDGVIFWECQQATGHYTYPGQPYIAPTAGQPYIAPTSGQPYIAPSSGGGPYYGTNTTVTLNGVTYTYQAGYGGAATPRTDIITLPGDVAYTLAYSVGSGGSVNYTYTAGTLGTDVDLLFNLNPTVSLTNYTGSGTVNIPAHVITITLTGKGGDGTTAIGPSTTVTLNGTTHTFVGGLGGSAPTSTKYITLPATSILPLVYSVAGTGNLSVTYDVPNAITTASIFSPQYIKIKCLSSAGDWIEIDDVRGMTNTTNAVLTTNTTNAETNTLLVKPKTNGFTLMHTTVNKLNEKYIYMVVRKPYK